MGLNAAGPFEQPRTCPEIHRIKPRTHALIEQLHPAQPTQKEIPMDEQHIKGAAKKVEGEIKETAGEMTDNKKLEAEGKMDKAEGEVRDKAGDVKDALKQ